MRIPGEIVRVRVAEVDADRLVAMLGFHGGELLADYGEGLVPLDLFEDRRTVVVEATPDNRLAEPIRIFVQLLEGRTLRADEALGEHVVLIATDPLDRTVLDLDLQTTRRLAERAGAKHGAVGRSGAGHDRHACRRAQRTQPSTVRRMELIPLCTLDATIGGMHLIGTGPAGARTIAEVSGGSVTGERLNGTVKGNAAADWMRTSKDGIASLDVRVVVETDDGALIYITYEGRADWSEGPGTKPIYMAPKFETSDERYTWLNAVQAVGKGQLGAGTVSYEIAEVR